ncbi:MAG TPA: glycosyltransferase family 4 protein [Candidatus Acidoferrales bacterium]|nr:glycosyltransferase family 4 protein [Candidatus Acidoferrales bacterium]
MKILVVTNLYPPQHVGGYELGCRDVVEKLRARGHAVRVLTSTFRNGNTENPPGETGVERVLQCNTALSDPPHDKRAEHRKLVRAIREFSPDTVYFWNQAGLSQWLPFAAYWHGCRLSFFLSDTNFVSWRIGAWLAGPSQKYPLIRALFGRTFLVRGWPVIQNRPCHFASEFLRQVALKNGIGFAARNSLVAHWGIDFTQFAAAPRARWPVTRLLYAGQLIRQKGVHTAIAALALLGREKEFSGLTLTIAGSGLQPDYEKEIRALPAELGIPGRVNFLGRVPRAHLPRVYAEHDALIFPSEWEEPFAITPLEAIHCGLAVVGTTTGGSGELFRNRETAMTFATGNAADCARAIRELCADPELSRRISLNAQREVREKHTLDAMVDAIEQNLKPETGN